MKPLKGKRMELAMHPARFSRRAARTGGWRIRMDRRRPARAPLRRTSCGCASTSVRTRSESVREGRSRRLGVASVTARARMAGTGPRCRSACLFWLVSLCAGRLSTVVDCVQCTRTASGRRGGDFVPCAQDVGGHMASSDPS